MFAEAAAIYRGVLGSDHPDTQMAERPAACAWATPSAVGIVGGLVNTLGTIILTDRWPISLSAMQLCGTLCTYDCVGLVPTVLHKRYKVLDYGTTQMLLYYSTACVVSTLCTYACVPVVLAKSMHERGEQ